MGAVAVLLHLVARDSSVAVLLLPPSLQVRAFSDSVLVTFDPCLVAADWLMRRMMMERLGEAQQVLVHILK